MFPIQSNVWTCWNTPLVDLWARYKNSKSISTMHGVSKGGSDWKFEHPSKFSDSRDKDNYHTYLNQVLIGGQYDGTSRKVMFPLWIHANQAMPTYSKNLQGKKKRCFF